MTLSSSSSSSGSCSCASLNLSLSALRDPSAELAPDREVAPFTAAEWFSGLADDPTSSEPPKLPEITLLRDYAEFQKSLRFFSALETPEARERERFAARQIATYQRILRNSGLPVPEVDHGEY